ncbi:MAG: nitroreductase family protein [Pseudomonadales bacterium]|nr:nitroreductase family protein [Pseudomonadales bacterium]
MGMDLYEAMSTLRAVRRLRPDPLPEAVLGRILAAAAWAPSGGNVQPWRVLVVRDPERKRAIGDLYRAEWARYGKGARAGLERLEGDARARQARMLAAADHLGEHMGDAPVILVFCFNPTHMAITDSDLGRPSVVGGGSVYPAVQNTMLACRAEGVGCTLTTLLCYREAEIRALLEIPSDWYTCAFLPIGYPVLRGHGPISRRPVEKLAYADRWGTPYRGAPSDGAGSDGA